MVKRQTNYGLYFIALVVSGVIFTTGLLLGTQINEAKVSSLEKDISELEQMRNLQDTNMQLFSSLGEQSCVALEYYLETLVPELDELGSRVDYYESSADSKRYSSEEYLEMKESYMLLQVRYWILTKNLERNCGEEVNDIIYFYSNEDCDNCKDQGIILSGLKRENPDIMIFSLDTSLNVSTIEILRHSFNTTECPTTIINGQVKSGLQNKSEIEQLLLANSQNEEE